MGDVGRTVLIVDDDSDIAHLVEEVLSEDGYAITILSDARIEAIQEAADTGERQTYLSEA